MDQDTVNSKVTDYSGLADLFHPDLEWLKDIPPEQLTFDDVINIQKLTLLSMTIPTAEITQTPKGDILVVDRDMRNSISLAADRLKNALKAKLEQQTLEQEHTIQIELVTHDAQD
jgi:hypothetical protein